MMNSFPDEYREPFSMELPSLESIARAAAVIDCAMRPTPQYTWPLLNQRVRAEVWVKHENHSPVGAFKVRGGLVYLDWLRRAHPEVEGVIAATRGNHGQAVGFARCRYSLKAIVVVPYGNSIEKNRAMRALRVELVEHGQDFQATSEYADHVASDLG
jgi:threonine dehydratase